MVTTPQTPNRKKPVRAKTPDDPRQAFVMLATRRVNRAVGVIQSIRPLTNKTSYQYTQGDIDKMHSALVGACNTLKSQFEAALKGAPAGSTSGFSL